MKINNILLTFLVLVGFVSIAQADFLTVDTRIGYYSVGSLVPYRTSRVEYGVPMLFSARVVHQVYNGMGLKGDVDNNYRLGLQCVYDFSLPIGFSAKPFAGFSLSSSDSLTNSLSFDLGGEVNYSLMLWMGVTIGAEAVTFSDSYMLDYYAGPNFPILPFLTADVLYTGLLSNNTHKIGFAGRVNLSF